MDTFVLRIFSSSSDTSCPRRKKQKKRPSRSLESEELLSAFDPSNLEVHPLEQPEDGQEASASPRLYSETPIFSSGERDRGLR